MKLTIWVTVYLKKKISFPFQFPSPEFSQQPKKGKEKNQNLPPKKKAGKKEAQNTQLIR